MTGGINFFIININISNVPQTGPIEIIGEISVVQFRKTTSKQVKDNLIDRIKFKSKKLI